MSQRTRVVALIVLCLLAVGGTTGYLAVARAQQQLEQRSAPAQATAAPGTLAREPRIVFRNTAIGGNYGKVAMVPLDDPSGARVITSTACDRVFATMERTLCLASDFGLVTTYTARTWADARPDEPTDLQLTGVPSRARLSDSGRLAATTSFVSGDSYAAANFSTRTVVAELSSGTSLDLERFRLVHRGKVVAPVDRNYWGVTFASDDDTFYVTVQFKGTAWLARGRVSTRSVETIRSDAECPSLSPDGSRIAYKKRGERRPGDWRIAVMDVATLKETVLAEERSVDDQVEWLDDGQILYGLPGEGSRAAETNVWVVNADGSGSPRLLIRQAWSPSVVR